MNSSTSENLSFVWLEITGRCQLKCLHCYAESGPAGTHGVMRHEDWRRVIDQVAELGSTMVQFIGGEPTLHPHLPDLIAHAHRSELAVEVFTNLTHVTPRLWTAFAENEVSLACSYYSDDPLQHAAITGRTGSYARTRANIIEALSRSIPLRVGVTEIDEAQRVDEVFSELRRLGVTAVGYDRLRQVGRGVRDQAAAVDQLCGHCANEVLAISPDGEVWPCVFSRWLPVGNVLSTPLEKILAGTTIARVRADLRASFSANAHRSSCNPTRTGGGQNCGPTPCGPETRSGPLAYRPAHHRSYEGAHGPSNPGEAHQPQGCGPTECTPTQCTPTQCTPAQCTPAMCIPAECTPTGVHHLRSSRQP